MRAPSAVLLLATTVFAQAEAGLRERVDQALERARPVLVHNLEKTHGDALGLVCLAARHLGMDESDESYAEALKRLAALRTQNTYGLALRCMVAASDPTMPDRVGIAKRDGEQLLKHQQKSGGFGYRPHESAWDLSNTQFAALGLRAAASLGLEIEDKVWKALLAELLDAQKSQGGFTYKADHGKRQQTMSMTAAGITSIQICRQMLRLDGSQDRLVEGAVDHAWRWMDSRVQDVGDRRLIYCLYAHTSLQRAGILSAKDAIAGAPWFAKTAEMILAMQRKDGAFSSPKDAAGHGKAVPTALALLFLQQKFQRDLVPGLATTPAESLASMQLEAGVGELQIRAAADVDARLGLAAVPGLLLAMRADEESRRRAAARALFLISGEDFRYHPGRSVDQNTAALRRAEKWWLGRRSRR